MNAKSNITVSDLGKIAFDPDLGPEEGAEAAWAHILMLIDEHNELQSKALSEGWNEALDRASDLIGKMADNEKERGTAISLNAAAISISSLKKPVD